MWDSRDSVPRGEMAKLGESQQDHSGVEGRVGEIPCENQSYFVIKDISSISTAGMAYMARTPKENQDRLICIPKFRNVDSVLLGVFDGHGSNGHIVSQFLKDQIPKFLESEISKHISPRLALSNVFACITNRIQKEMAARCSYSGSTACITFIQGNSIHCANLGDSRAIIGHENYDGNFLAIPLSRDHSPSVLEERERIINSGGRVEACKDATGADVGPLRVWLKNQRAPGLAMTRAFGDFVAASVGVISIPDIYSRELEHGDRYLILASDGVWEFISNEEAVEIVRQCDNAKDACRRLMEESRRRWISEEGSIDDITAIVVFL